MCELGYWVGMKVWWGEGRCEWRGLGGVHVSRKCTGLWG